MEEPKGKYRVASSPKVLGPQVNRSTYSGRSGGQTSKGSRFPKTVPHSTRVQIPLDPLTHF
jgi:hypothetical protein